jgi:hypothetical protein
MKGIFALLAAAAVSAVLLGIAQAKGPISAQVCGESACIAISDAETLSGLARAALSDEAIAVPPAPAQPYFALRLTMGEGPRAPHLTVYYLPEASLLRTSTGWSPVEALWTSIDADTDSALRELTRTLVPFAPPTVTAASVGTRRVRHPGSYLQLYAVRSAGKTRLRGADWLPIRLRSRTPSPWTDGANWLQYSPRARVLVRDAEFVKLDRRTGRALRLGLALPGTSWRASLAMPSRRDQRRV